MSKHPDIAKVREYLIESGYPEDGDALLSLAAVEAELDSKAASESALTKAEAVATVCLTGERYAHAPPAVPVESLGRDAEPAGGLDAAMRANGLPAVSDALGYSRNFAAANPHLTQTTKDHITGLCDMLELASAHQTTPPAPPPASGPHGWQLVPIEPRLGMLDALSFALFGDARLTFGDRREAFRRGYAAMLAATPPTNQEGAAP